MRKLFAHLKPYAFLTALAVASVVVGALTELGLPFYIAEIVNSGVANRDLTLIVRTGGVMLSLAFISAASSIFTGYLAARVSSGMGRSLRAEIFQTVQRFSLADIDRFGTASLITRSTNDVTQIQGYVMALFRMVLRAPILAVGGIAMAYLKSPLLSLVLLAALPALFVAVTAIARRSVPISAEMQQRLDAVTLVMREKLTGVRVVRAFCNEQHERVRFDAASAALTDASQRMARVISLLMPCANLVMGMTIAAVVWFGGIGVNQGGVLVGDVIALVQYITQILMAVMLLSFVFVMLPRAAASAQRINEVLDASPAVTDPATPSAGDGAGVLRFENVSFFYPGTDEPALSDLSFTARPGVVTAVIGSTGSGKTTLLHLILRFYDASCGRILLDGVDVRDYRQSDLRARMGYVSQKAMLFSGSIADNIRQGKPDADDAQIRAAAKLAQADDFIAERAEGYDAPVAQAGANLSGGQKQRLAVARAAVRKPRIYLFDDSFSALDYATDARLRAALARQTSDSTVLIVAQRVSTIKNAGQILVLDGGRLAGVGTHDELLAGCEVYREIVASQQAGEEERYG